MDRSNFSKLVDAELAKITKPVVTDELRQALNGMISAYVELVNCGDCGNWNPEKDLAVINARAALTVEPKEGV